MIECPHCGHNNESFFRFCLKCGGDLTSTAAPAAPAQADLEVPKQVELAARPLVQDTVEVPVADVAAATAEPEPIHALGAATTVDTSQLDVPDVKPNIAWQRVDPLTGDSAVTGDSAEADAPVKPQPAKPEWFAPTQELTEEDAFSGPEPDEAPDTVDEHDDATRLGVRAHTDIFDEEEESQGTTGPEEVPAALGAPSGIKAPEDASKRCPGCGAKVEQSHIFCGHCGFRFDADVEAQEAADDDEETSKPTAELVQTVGDRTNSRARLVLIMEDGSDGDDYSLFEGVNTVGREGTAVEFDGDVYLDPYHADLVVEGDLVTVTDQGSLNGTFIRITEPALIEHNDTFRLGQELLRYEDLSRMEQPSGEADTDLLGARPPEGTWGRLVQLMTPEIVGNSFLLSGRFVTIGRERGDITFNGDGYVSGRHATLTRRNGSLYLEDLDSSNGTYIRIKGSAAVFDGDLLLMGQQLFRITF